MAGPALDTTNLQGSNALFEGGSTSDTVTNTGNNNTVVAGSGFTVVFDGTSSSSDGTYNLASSLNSSAEFLGGAGSDTISTGAGNTTAFG